MSAPLSPFVAKLLEPHTTEDWLDRREALEREERAARHLAIAEDWLRKHHPRFGGRAV